MSQLRIRSLPALSASMPMWDVLQLFKIGRAHMAVLCEAPESARPARDHCTHTPSHTYTLAAPLSTSPKPLR